jgi:hypothetical protein
MGLVDALTGTFRMPCPAAGSCRVRLSSFREIEQLPGTAHPTVFRVVFACACGDEHLALVGHDALDRAPLGLDEQQTFVNLMTSRRDDLGSELVALASAHIHRGEWPWSFFCFPEDKPRPVFPSAFKLLTAGDERLGLAVECPSCARTSVNVVTRPHVDVPFYNDEHVEVVEHIFVADREDMIERFRAQLDSVAFDASRRRLAA